MAASPRNLVNSLRPFEGLTAAADGAHGSAWWSFTDIYWFTDRTTAERSKQETSGNFRTQVYDEQRDEHLSPAQDLRTLVVVKDADDELVLSRSFGSDGKFIFTSRKAGGHQVCLRSDSSHLPLSTGRMLTVHLDIKVGERTNNYTKIAAEDKLTELQLRIRQLAEQVQQIQREQVYQRIREEYFREVTHSTNMWIFWWPVLRSLYVVGMIMWLTKSW
uniref:Transmembrane p24 trafficking protein 9 n=1 Tax=Lates calcarifer TaxID=8187 RepID=A0A4W6G7J8_LATCA